MSHLKLAVTLFAALFLVACKIQISVPERGGRVLSENIVCETGQQCDLVVETADFNEVFVAQPAAGYDFVGWRQAPAYFCGGSDGDCTVSTLLFAGNPTLLSFLTLDLDYFLEPIFACQEDNSGTPASECGLSGRTLSGEVRGVSAAGAAVTLTVNGQSFSTVVNGQGGFSLTLDAAADELVTAVLESADVQLAAIAGSVEDAESGGITLSPVTTALYGLAVSANNGAIPVNSGQLYAAETSVDPDTLLDVAAALSLIIEDDSYSLPSGVDDFLDFVSSPSAWSAFIAEINETDALILADRAALLETDSFAQANIAARYVSVAPSVPGYVSRFGELVDLSGPGQAGAVRGSDFFGELLSDAVSWAVSGGDLVLSYSDSTSTGVLFSAAETSATPEQLILLEAEEAASFVQYSYVDTRIDDRFTLIESGQFVEITSLEQRSNRSFDPVQLAATGGGTLELADTVLSASTGENLRAEESLPTIPFAAQCTADLETPCVPGTWGGLYLSSPGNDFGDEPLPVGSFADVITFLSDGTALGDITGKSATWTVNGGKLVIDFGDGSTQTVTLIQQVGMEYGALVEYSINGELFADYNVYVKRDESLLLNEALVTNIDGSFWSSDLVAYEPGNKFDANGNRDPESTFGFSFYNVGGGQTGFTEIARFSDGGFTLERNPLTWSLEAARVNFNRVPGTDRARYFYPLAFDVTAEGRRLFGVEYEVRNDFSPNVIVIPPRTTIYAEVPLPASD